MVNIGLTNYDIIEDFKQEAYKKGYKIDAKMAVEHDLKGALYGEYKRGIIQGEKGTILAIRIWDRNRNSINN